MLFVYPNTYQLPATEPSTLFREVASTWQLDSLALRRHLAAVPAGWRYLSARRDQEFLTYTYYNERCGYAQKWDYHAATGRMMQMRVAVRHDMPETQTLLLQGFQRLEATQQYHPEARVRAWLVHGQTFTMIVLYFPSDYR